MASQYRLNEIVGAPVSTYIIPECAGIRVLLQVVFVPQTSAEEPLSETSRVGHSGLFGIWGLLWSNLTVKHNAPPHVSGHYYYIITYSSRYDGICLRSTYVYGMSKMPATTGDRIGILINIRSNKDSTCHIYTLILTYPATLSQVSSLKGYGG